MDTEKPAAVFSRAKFRRSPLKKKRDIGGIADILGKFLSRRGLLAIVKDQDAIRLWPKIAGEKICSVTRCDRVEDGVLFVRVANASWRQELHFCKESLLEAIRREIPGATIRDIKFI